MSLEVGGKPEIDDLMECKAGKLGMSKRTKYANSFCLLSQVLGWNERAPCRYFQEELNPSPRQVPGIESH